MSSRLTKSLERSKSDSPIPIGYSHRDWYPATREELRDRIINDPAYYLQRCCCIIDRRGGGLAPFRFNAAQRRYDHEIHRAGVVRDIDAKVRKWGLTTQRVGYQHHRSQFRRGQNVRAAAQSEGPAKLLADIGRNFRESAWQFFDHAGEDPRFYLPENTSDSVYGFVYRGINSRYTVTWGGARGLGRLETIDDLYVTEFAEWENAERSLRPLITARAPGAKDIRQTIDFNGHENWRGHYCAILWDNANKPQDDAEWNGWTPFFVGVDDLPEYYTEEFLADQLRAVNGDERKFRLEYPRTAQDLYVQRDIAVFDSDLVDAAARRSGGRYLFDFVPAAEVEHVAIGVDSSRGYADGDFQVMITFGWHNGMWHEAEPPLCVRMDEDAFAMRVVERAEELNCVGYKHRHRDREGKQRRQLGFPMTAATKKIAIGDMVTLLRQAEVALVTPALVAQLKDYEWKTRDDGSSHESMAGAPDRPGAHDDLVTASMVAMQGANSTDGNRICTVERNDGQLVLSRMRDASLGFETVEVDEWSM